MKGKEKKAHKILAGSMLSRSEGREKSAEVSGNTAVPSENTVRTAVPVEQKSDRMRR